MNGSFVVRPQSLADGMMVGNLLPDEEVDLSFETSGKIVEINFKEGLSAGERLAKVNMTNRCWRSCRATKRSSSWPRTGFTARARCSKRTPSVRRPTSRPARSWRCSTRYRHRQGQYRADELRAVRRIIGLRRCQRGRPPRPSVVVAKLTKISPLKIDLFVPKRYASQIRPGTPLSFTVEGRNETFRAEVYAQGIEGGYRHAHAGRAGALSWSRGNAAAGRFVTGENPPARYS